MRRRLFTGTLAVGLALIVMGLLLATGAFGDGEVMLEVSPIASSEGTPFAALVFTLGVMIVFLSAVVYELVPGRRSK